MIIVDQDGVRCDELPASGDWMTYVDDMTVAQQVVAAYIMEGCACDGCAAMKLYMAHTARESMLDTPPLEQEQTCLLWLVDNYTNIVRAVDYNNSGSDEDAIDNDIYIH